jgi:hypothetical protein
MMGAEPFATSDDIRDARREFSAHIRQILTFNREVGERLSELSADKPQVTNFMDPQRSRPLVERREIYLKARIREQRSWYVSKARINRRRHNLWVVISVLIYGIAISIVLAKLRWASVGYLSSDPFLVLAAAAIGWIQVKKHSELASIYTLTAHEIGLIETRIHDATDETEFSEFVNEAELAFSREHTQWVARQGAFKE